MACVQYGTDLVLRQIIVTRIVDKVVSSSCIY